jgi:hypothetical protein
MIYSDGHQPRMASAPPNKFISTLLLKTPFSYLNKDPGASCLRLIRYSRESGRPTNFHRLSKPSLGGLSDELYPRLKEQLGIPSTSTTTAMMPTSSSTGKSPERYGSPSPLQSEQTISLQNMMAFN